MSTSSATQGGFYSHLGIQGVTLVLFAGSIASYFLFPEHLALLTQLFVLMVFALSYDLLQGHGGIVSLGMRRSSVSAPMRPRSWRAPDTMIRSSASPSRPSYRHLSRLC